MQQTDIKDTLQLLNAASAAFDVALNLSSFPSIHEYNTVRNAKEMVTAHLIDLSSGAVQPLTFPSNK